MTPNPYESPARLIAIKIIAAVISLAIYLAAGAVVPRGEFGFGWGCLGAIECELRGTRRLFAEPFPCARRQHWQGGYMRGYNAAGWLIGHDRGFLLEDDE